MKQIEYRTVKWLMEETLQTQMDILADLGDEGWQVFHLHEMILSGKPTVLIYARREKATNDLVHQNGELKRKLVAAYVLAAQHGVAYKAIDESAEVIEIGHHACPTSPIGVCAYDGDDDPSRDDCLFCHDPDERK